MKDGQIAQSGTHDELIGVSGPYQEIYELQLRPQETSGPDNIIGPTRKNEDLTQITDPRANIRGDS